MSTNFPSNLDNGVSLPYPSALSKRNGPSLAGLNDNQNDAVIATQTKLGTSASTPTANNLLIGTGAGTSTWSKLAPTGVIVGSTDTQTLTNKTLTSPTITSPIISNATLSTDLISGFTTSNSGTVFGVPVTTGIIQTANTVSGASLVAGSVGTTALATNAVQANQLATNAIYLGSISLASLYSSSATTATQVTGMSVTVTIPAGSRRTKITFYSAGVYSSGAVGDINLSIWDGAVGTGTRIFDLHSSGLPLSNPNSLTGISIVTVAAGSKTYNVGCQMNGGGGGTANIQPSGTVLIVEAI